MPLSMQDWFCFKQGRESFKPRLPKDSALVLCHQSQIDDQVINSILMRFATNDPVKMIIAGDWGVGKTHLLYHLKWWFEQNKTDYPAYPVCIEIGDISKKSLFSAVVSPFLDELGLPFIIELVDKFRAKGCNVADELKKRGVSPGVADAFAKFLLSSPGQAPVPLVRGAFEYLKGASVGGGVGMDKPIKESKEFFDVLLSLGEMYKEVYGHRIIFMADEAAKLEQVESDPQTQNHWMTANKLIFDDRNRSFGFIYTASGQIDVLPAALIDNQIISRLGERNRIALKTLEPADVKKFLSALVEEFVDKSKVDALNKAGKIGAGYDWNCYPFTTDGLEHFLEYFNRTQESAKPRDIAAKLEEAGFYAGKNNKRLIDSACCTAVNL